MEWFGYKVRQSRLIWYGHVKCRNDDYNVGRKGAGDVVARKKKNGKTKDDVFGCGVV